MSTPDVYAQLASYGFKPVTAWALRGARIKVDSLGWEECAGWIYAFVCEGRVRYVGITTNVLRSRLDNYRDQADAERVRRLVLASLGAGHVVQIYGIKRQGIGGADLTAEESTLIKAFDTDWNVRR